MRALICRQWGGIEQLQIGEAPGAATRPRRGADPGEGDGGQLRRRHHGRRALPDQAGAAVQPGAGESEVVEMRETKSRPGDGIVIFAHRAFNQNSELLARPPLRQAETTRPFRVVAT
jgi:hypothetical protein